LNELKPCLAGDAHISWAPVLFFAVTSLGATAWPFYAWKFGVTTREWVLFAMFFCAGGLSITVGYHRLLSHHAFECSPLVKWILLVLAASTWSGSALTWVRDHMQHHSRLDTELDPYSTRRGFWHAQMGWMFRDDIPRMKPPRSLSEDPLVVWQDRHIVLLATMFGIVLPFALAGLGGLLLLGFVRITLTVQLEGLINSWAHIGSGRKWNPHVSAVDNPLLALLTFGEGWHSYHHRFPNDYRLGAGALQWDPGKWTIWILSRCGLAWNLKRADHRRHAMRAVRVSSRKLG
jgi:stearoyl-CoA desaturase (delta-9 desaturase)